MNKYKIEPFIDVNGEYRVRIDAPNGQNIFTNGEGLKNKKDMVQMLVNFLEAIKQDNYEITEISKIITR
jgi:uncharacterized protein YegP (UPF0339 family)